MSSWSFQNSHPHINHPVQDKADNSCRWLSVYYVLGCLLNVSPALSQLILHRLGGKNHYHTHLMGGN